MNQRVSSLIPGAKPAESAEHGAKITQKAAHRLARPSGSYSGITKADCPAQWPAAWLGLSFRNY
jgi:hypothetical protein